MSDGNSDIEFESQTGDQVDAALQQALDGAELIDQSKDERGDQEKAELSVDQRLANAQREVLVAQAELENFRKRMFRETEQQLKYANLPLVRDLLDVIDNLNRATDAAKADTAQAGNQALLTGVEMVLTQVGSVLSKYGCKPIESVGKAFDPNLHQAISQLAGPQAAGTVAHEVAIGYTLHDRVVRPSSVIVSTGPEA
jgi:molecular chaperone GrpE